MIESDTIKLLRECDAGVKMGVSTIDEVLKYVDSSELKQHLEKSKKDNDDIKEELQDLLNDYHDEGKELPAMARGMAWIKTNVKLTVNESDDAVAELITDGCNMGVKSLAHYLNQYKAADEKSKNLAKKLIGLEEELAVDMRKFL